MSLYNTLFGANPLTPVLLKILDLNPEDVPRLRDVNLSGDGKTIIVYTRTGGGNRDYYDSEQDCRDNYPEYFAGDDPPTGPWNDDLRKHPLFIQDYDDDFDSTYAYFDFKVPDEWASELEALAKRAPDATTPPSEKWQALLYSMDSRPSSST